MRCEDKKAGLLLERSFLGDLDAEGFQALQAHLAGCEECRDRYDRQARVERRLEKSSAPLPAAHLDLIGAAVVARILAAEQPRKARWGWWLPVPVALAVAVVALFVIRGPDEFQARSGAPAKVEGLRAFCIGGPAAEPRILSAADAATGAVLRCGLGEALQFSYSTGREALHLAIVSLPEAGEGAPIHYVAEGATVPVAAGAIDEPLPYSSRLAVRHAPGRRALFALFFDQPRTGAEVEAVAALARAAKPTAARVVLPLTLVVAASEP